MSRCAIGAPTRRPPRLNVVSGETRSAQVEARGAHGCRPLEVVDERGDELHRLSHQPSQDRFFIDTSIVRVHQHGACITTSRSASARTSTAPATYSKGSSIRSSSLGGSRRAATNSPRTTLSSVKNLNFAGSELGITLRQLFVEIVVFGAAIVVPSKKLVNVDR
jgi:hypothetical protein